MSDYNLKRFRYTGRSNPSRVFMLLQDATGTTEENLNGGLLYNEYSYLLI